ncbi:hypothetical protein [Klenkia sp. PcliD-1-E]|uniref:hypothetical protein n=1 Tax=Klenkia sp. PcliD-1-E TaxID=2954492 RepID=UPI002096B20E|nr:hypothetical protein [Klenkia sp. PcliD-1-E]MCO7219369.1 hypothetical protein [Klenkia sp. PcliD-1-E]
MRTHRLRQPAAPADAVVALGLPTGVPVLVVVGGAGGVDAADAAEIDRLVAEVVLPAVRACGASIVDGGTDSGVMRSIGRAASVSGWTGPLVGVAVGALVGVGRVPLEPHHTHVVLVDGDDWGDETVPLADVAGAIAVSAPTATLLLNGGPVSRDDVAQSRLRGRTVLVAGSTGRLARELAAAPPAGTLVLPTDPVEQRGLLERVLTHGSHRLRTS